MQALSVSVYDSGSSGDGRGDVALLLLLPAAVRGDASAEACGCHGAAARRAVDLRRTLQVGA